MKKLFKITPLKLSMLLGTCLAVVVVLQDSRQWNNWLPYRLELKVLDFKFMFRGPLDFKPEVVIAAGDQKSLEQFGVWGSWKRSVYAEMLKNLFDAEADVVAFDMVWGDEMKDADPLKFKRLADGFDKLNLTQESDKTSQRAEAARLRLNALDASLKSAEKAARNKKPLLAAVAEVRKARDVALKELTDAEEAARSMSEGAQAYRDSLDEEANRTADDELVEVLGKYPTKIVMGYIAETTAPKDPAQVEQSFSRIASTAVDELYRDIKSENASAGARVARTLMDMCEGKPLPCNVGGEDLVSRTGMEMDELMSGARELQAAKAATLTDDGVRVEDLLALAKVREVGPATVMVEWLPGNPDPRETERNPGVDTVTDLVAPLAKFAEVGQNYGYFAAFPDPDGVFRGQPLVYRYFPPEPHEDAAKCTSCNRRMLSPERLASLEDASKCSQPCKESCPECFVHAYYLQSLSLALVQQRYGMTPTLIRNQDYPWMQSIKEVALLPMEPVARTGEKANNPRHITTDLKGRLLLNYYGTFNDEKGGTRFPVVSVADIVNNKFDKSLVKGKAVIFAVTALGTYDQRSTPFDSFVPGVVIHATAAQNMFEGRFLHRPLELVGGEAAFLFLMGILLGLLLPRLSVPAGFVVFILLAGAYWAVDIYGFFTRGYWVHSFWPFTQLLFTLIIIQAHGYLTVGREKQAMRKAFGACLDPMLVEELAANPDTLTKLKGDEREASCMFSDIRGFTTLSENLTPVELTVFLNDYFTRQADALMHHKGYLDKYIGDAIMALFGAPQAFPDHAVAGCYAALDMMDELKAFKKWVVTDPKWTAFCQRLISKHMDPGAFDIGIGINTGMMRVGYMGSAQRTNYSALGDAVNLASRLEGQTKEYGVHVIIGESTMAAAKGKVTARLLDSIRVKGKKEPVRIYECIAKGDPTPPWAQFIKTFETGIELYLQKRFADAVPYFAQALREKPLDADYEEELRKKGKPRDLISAEYISRCMEYQQNPPPPDWDGVVTKTSK